MPKAARNHRGPGRRSEIRKTVLKPREQIVPDTDCPICFDEITIENGCTLDGCPHKFHYRCALSWLHNHANTCPICRTVTGMVFPTTIDLTEDWLVLPPQHGSHMTSTTHLYGDSFQTFFKVPPLAEIRRKNSARERRNDQLRRFSETFNSDEARREHAEVLQRIRRNGQN